MIGPITSIPSPSNSVSSAYRGATSISDGIFVSSISPIRSEFLNFPWHQVRRKSPPKSTYRAKMINTAFIVDALFLSQTEDVESFICITASDKCKRPLKISLQDLMVIKKQFNFWTVRDFWIINKF